MNKKWIFIKIKIVGILCIFLCLARRHMDRKQFQFQRRLASIFDVYRIFFFLLPRFIFPRTPPPQKGGSFKVDDDDNDSDSGLVVTLPHFFSLVFLFYFQFEISLPFFIILSRNSLFVFFFWPSPATTVSKIKSFVRSASLFLAFRFEGEFKIVFTPVSFWRQMKLFFLKSLIVHRRRKFCSFPYEFWFSFPSSVNI